MEKFNHPYYMDVRPLETNLFHVHIKDENGKSASFLNNVTTCTFHLRKKVHLKDCTVFTGEKMGIMWSRQWELVHHMKDGTLIQKNSIGYYFVESRGCHKARRK